LKAEAYHKTVIARSDSNFRYWFSFKPLRDLSDLCVSAIVVLGWHYHRRDGGELEVAQRMKPKSLSEF
jgi:hypothetical protein